MSAASSNHNPLVLARHGSRALATSDQRRTSLINRYAPADSHYFGFDPGPILHLSVSADGSRLCGAASRELFVWDTAARVRIARFAVGQPIACVALDETGALAVVGDSNGSLHFFDVDSGACTRQPTVADSLTRVAASPDAALVAFSDARGCIRVLRRVDMVTIASIDMQQQEVLDLALDTASGLLLVAAREVTSIYLLATGETVAVYRADDDAAAETHSPWRRILVRGTGRIVLFDTLTGTRSEAPAPAVGAIDATRDGVGIAAAIPNLLLVYGRVVSEAPRVVSTYVHVLEDLRICPRGERIYSCGENSAVDMHSASGRWLGGLASEYALIVGARLSADDRHLVVADEMGIVSCYDTRTGRVSRYRQHTSCIAKLKVQGSWAATSGYDGTAAVLDLRSGATVRRIATDRAPMQAVALDGNEFILTGNTLGAVERHGIEDGRLHASYAGNRHAVRSVCVSACRRYVLTTSDGGEALLFDYASGALLHRWTVPGTTYEGCFSADGELCFFGDNFGAIWKVKSATGEVASRWRPLESAVRAICIRGAQLCAVGLRDDAVLIDWHNERVVLRVALDGRSRHRVAFLNAAGTRFITGAQDGRLRFHDRDNGAKLAELHNLSEGFLWSTPEDREETGHGAWFWTDRTELVSVQASAEGKPRLLDPADSEHAEYVRARNSRSATLARVGLGAAHSAPGQMSELIETHRSVLAAAAQTALLEHRPTD